MIFFVSFNPDTGKITARRTVSDDSQMANYPNSIQVSEAVFRDEPEKKKKFNKTTRRLENKIQVTVTPEAATFPADGVSELDVTFSGLTHDVDVMVGAQIVAVEQSSPVLTLTSDAPRTFNIYLNDNDHWAEPVSVRAV